MRKFLVLLVGLCLVLALCLTACKQKAEEKFKLPDLGEAPFSIATAGAKTEYQLVYADGLSEVQIARVEAAVATINATYSGIELKAVKDSESTATGKEILLGETSRSESKEVYSEITGINQASVKLGEDAHVILAASSREMVVELFEAFVRKYVQGDKDGVFNIPAMMNFEVGEPALEGWLLKGVLSYPGGTYSTATYDDGPGKSLDYRKSAGQMQVVSGTTAEEFKAYIDQMAANGFTVESREDADGNISAQFYNETQEKSLVYAYYTAGCCEARIVEDNESTFVKKFEYVCEEGPVSIYQYGIMHNSQGSGTPGEPYGNNGMTYVIRLADNKLIVVDGGSESQATSRATREFVQFMQEITQDDDGVVDIAAYFITHLHSDHYAFMQRILETDSLASIVNIERLMWNTTTLSKQSYYLGGLFEERYPNAQFLKLHTGQKFRLGNLDCEVMFTHEDFVDAETAESHIIDFNNTSTVLKWTANGRSFLQFGDWGGQWYISDDYAYGEERMLTIHPTDDTGYNALKSDIVQISHHALNPYMKKLNILVAGEYAFVPTSDVKFSQLKDQGRTDAICGDFIEGGTDPDKLYFASRYTYALQIDKDGAITVAAENIRGVDKGDDRETADRKEVDYIKEILTKTDPYRVPTDEEFANWDLIH